MLKLHHMGRCYGTLPSAVIGEEDEYLALSINLWAHNYSVQEDDQERRRIARGR